MAARWQGDARQLQAWRELAVPGGLPDRLRLCLEERGGTVHWLDLDRLDHLSGVDDRVTKAFATGAAIDGFVVGTVSVLAIVAILALLSSLSSL